MTGGERRAVLLLDGGDTPHLLAAVRAFAAAGWRVGLGGGSAGSRVARSRHVHRVHPVPPLEHGVDALVAGIAAAVRDGGYDLVFPGDDAELLALSAARDGLAARFPYPPHAVVVRAVDKLELVSAARAAGLAAPDTVAATPASLAGVRLPVVVKPALHWSPDRGARDRHLPVRMCDTRAEVDAAVGEIVAGGGSALLQQPVSGELMALTVVADARGDLLAAVQQRTSVLTLRGTSARAVTVAVDPDLLRGVRELLRLLGWTGLANVQFLRPVGGDPHVIDFNARFYGSMALATAAGVSLPVLWARSALDEPPPAGRPVTGRPGLRFQAFEEDVRRARAHRRGGLVRDVAATLAQAPRSVHPAWSVADPLPGLVSAARLIRAAGRAAARSVR